MQLYRLYLIIFVIAFFLITLIPLILVDTKTIASSENRNLAVLDGGFFNKNFPKEFEKFFNDRFGYRGSIIAYYKRIMYYCFKISEYQFMIIGKGDNITYKEEAFMEHIEGDMKHLQAFSELEKTVMEISPKRVTPIFFVGIPTPFVVKHEMLPKYITMRVPDKYFNSPWQNEAVKGRLSYNDTIPSDEFREKFLIYPFEEARFLNKIIEIFPNRNFHWVELSPYTDMVANIVANRIVAYDKNLNDIYDNSIDLSKYNVRCQHITDTWYVLGFAPDNAPFYCRAKDNFIKKSNFYEYYNYGNGSRLLDDYHLFYYNDKPKIDKKILVFGDSFGPGLVASLASYFREILYIRMKNPTSYDDTLSFIKNNYDYDYIINVFNNHLKMDSSIVKKVIKDY